MEKYIIIIFISTGLEQELGNQKESYDQKLSALEKQLEEATAGDKIAKKEDLDRLTADFNERVKDAENNSTRR